MRDTWQRIWIPFTSERLLLETCCGGRASPDHDHAKVTALLIIEFAAYAIIGLAGFLTVGGAIFLVALRIHERMEHWLVDRKARKTAAPR